MPSIYFNNPLLSTFFEVTLVRGVSDQMGRNSIDISFQRPGTHLFCALILDFDDY